MQHRSRSSEPDTRTRPRGAAEPPEEPHLARAVSDCLTVWLNRYLILDLAGLAGALLLGSAAHGLAGERLPWVVGAVLGDYLGFYGAAWSRERMRGRRRGRGSRGGAWLALRRVVAEFAVAELVDCSLIRPLLLVAAARLCGSPQLGIALGGCAADVVFYLVAGAWYRRTVSRARRASSQESGRRSLPRAAA